MLESVYHMMFKLFCNRVLPVKLPRFCQIYGTLLWTSFHKVTKIC